MNMYEIVKKQEGRPFPSYPHVLDCSVDTEYIIQTHPTDPKCGLIFRRLETGYDDACAYCYTTDGYDWIIADGLEVIAEAIRDARRWLALEKGGWARKEVCHANSYKR